MDLASLISRRSVLAQRHDDARARWPYTHADFVRTVQEVVSGLQEIAAEIIATRDIVEIARTKMWLGDALFDLAQGRNGSFSPALQIYGSAEELVRIAGNELLQAKFDANYANILLRAKSGPAELPEIIGRYQRALPVLEAREPAFARTIRTELGRAEYLRSQFQALQAEHDKAISWIRDQLGEVARYPDPGAFAPVTALLRDLERAHEDASRTGDLAAMLQMGERVRAAFQRGMREAAPAMSGPRGRLAATVMKLWAELSAKGLTAQLDKASRDRAFDLTADLVQAHTKLMNVADPEFAAICRRDLLPVASEGRRLLAGALVTWAEPIWPSGSAPELPHGLYATESRLRDEIAERGLRLGLELLQAPPGNDLAEARFEAMRRSAVVVADVPEDPVGRASACYELGIALALGRALVVLAPPGSTLPFNIEVQPITHPTDQAGWELFDDALERALLLPQRAPDQGSLTPLLNAARRHFAHLQASVDELERSLESPLQAAGVLANIVREQLAETGAPHLVIHAPWVRRQAEPGARRLFHVMPFGATWSDQLKQRTAAACKQAGVRYRRGDEVEDTRVIRSIWDEICLASHVLVDVSGFNPNVCLELAVAQVLGKSVLAVGQTGTRGQLFPMLKNVRVRDYSLSGEGYESLLANFLAAPGIAQDPTVRIESP